MWSVTLTDTLQMAFIFAGVIVLFVNAFTAVGSGNFIEGLQSLASQTPSEKLVLIPTASAHQFLGWLGILTVASLGNLPGQDLTQRIFSAKSAKVAQRACLLAGVLYICLGTLPVLLSLLAHQVLPQHLDTSVLPALARHFLSPSLMILFILALCAVVLSTIDSAILAPSAVMAHNVLQKVFPRTNGLKLQRYCVMGISALSILLALSGQKAYALLENSYGVGLASVFVPFVIAVYGKRLNENSALWAMVAGFLFWLPDFFLEDVQFPFSLLAVGVSWLVYEVHFRFVNLREPLGQRTT